MAQDKSSTIAANTGLFGKTSPRVFLEPLIDVEAKDFMKKPQSVSAIDIPPKQSKKDVLENTFVSQLSDGRLIYCYDDGEIGLYTTPLSNAASESFSLLPAGKTTAIYELPNQRLLICQKKQHPQLVDLNKKTSQPMNLPGVNVKSAIALDQNTVFIGTGDGKLIHWHLDNNNLINSWSIGDNNHPILCVAENINKQLFLVQLVNEGFSTGLFNQETGQFERLKLIPFDDSDLIGETILRIFYNRHGDLMLVTRSKISQSVLTVHPLMDNNISTQKLFNQDKAMSIFALS